MSKYRRITPEDRCQIYALNKRGGSQQGIAELLGISQSAVSRELRRNRGKRGKSVGAGTVGRDRDLPTCGYP